MCCPLANLFPDLLFQSLKGHGIPKFAKFVFRNQLSCAFRREHLNPVIPSSFFNDIFYPVSHSASTRSWTMDFRMWSSGAKGFVVMWREKICKRLVQLHAMLSEYCSLSNCSKLQTSTLFTTAKVCQFILPPLSCPHSMIVAHLCPTGNCVWVILFLCPIVIQGIT